MSPVALKLFLIVIMGIVPLIFGLLPLKVLDYLTNRPGGGSSHVRTIISVFTCFAAGVILGVSFIELFPEARESIENWIEENPHRAEYPFVELFVGVGFLLCYFVEEFMSLLFGHHHSHGHAHGGLDAPLRRRRDDCPHRPASRRGITNDAMSADSGSESGGTFTSGLCSFFTPFTPSSVGDLQTTAIAVGEKRPLSPRFDATPSVDYESMAPCNGATFQVSVVEGIEPKSTAANEDISLSPTSRLSHSIGNEEFGSVTQIATSSNGDVAAVKIVDDASDIESDDEKDCHRKAVIGAVTLVAALFFHTSLEGFAFGIQKELISVGSLFFGIIVHKILVFFSVGINMAQAMPDNPRIVVILIVMLASFSPIGAIIGIIVEEMEMAREIKGITSAILICVSIGTFIYIALFEVLAPERHKQVNRMLQWAGCAIGFALMSSVLSLGKHNHSAGHGHSHKHDATI